MSSLVTRFEYFSTRMGSLIDEFGPIERKAQNATARKVGQVTSGALCLVSAAGLGFTLLTGGLGAPFVIGASLAFGAEAVATGALCVILTEEADKLVKAVKVILEEFEIEVSAMAPIVRRVGEIFSSNESEKACYDGAISSIERYRGIVKNYADNEIVVSKLSQIMGEISEVVGSLTNDEGKSVLVAFKSLFEVCFVIRGSLLGKPVTAEIVEDVVRKLKLIRDQYNSILRQLRNFESNRAT